MCRGVSLEHRSAFKIGEPVDRDGDFCRAKVCMSRRCLGVDETYRRVLGLLLARQGSLDQAIEQFHAAVRLEPGYATAYFNGAKCLRRRIVSLMQSSIFSRLCEFSRPLLKFTRTWHSSAAGKKEEAI
jgi:hypothetical protein